MTNKTDNCVAEPQEQPIMNIEAKDGITLGLLANYKDSDETRFFLTPEACAVLSSKGFAIKMESKAAINIHYSDADYAQNGVAITMREEALQADVVISVLPIKSSDIRKMKKGASLLCMMDSPLFEKGIVKALIERHVTCICLDNLESFNGEPIFARIVDEIDGRAAIMYAQEGLSFLGEGKGVLLAGVAGVNPCEVLIIGEGWRVMSAAKAAIAVGAKVTLMNNDISALHDAKTVCGDHLVTTAIHPRVLYNTIKSADVILIDRCTRNFTLAPQFATAMKDNVYILDFETTHPSLSVPRTVAMAISNVMVNFLDDLMLHRGMDGFVNSCQGVRLGVVTYKGKLVDKLIGINTGMPCADLSVMTTGSN